MQKVQPAKNTLDMDFLNTFNKQIGEETPAATEKPAVTEVTEIDPTETFSPDFGEDEISINDSVPSKTIKTTQLVVRTTEKEREALKAYFMKHGVSVSKGIKIAIKYLEEQEKKGLVRFSDVGLY